MLWKRITHKGSGYVSLKKTGCDLIIHQGDTAYLDIKICKMPFEINPSDKLILSVAKRMTDKNAVIVKEVYAADFNGSTATFSFSESDTANLTPGDYYYGVRYHQSAGDTYYKFTAAADRKFIVKPHTPDILGVNSNGM